MGESDVAVTEPTEVVGGQPDPVRKDADIGAPSARTCQSSTPAAARNCSAVTARAMPRQYVGPYAPWREQLQTSFLTG